MPRAEVLPELQGRDHEVMRSEHVRAEMFANEHSGTCRSCARGRWVLETVGETEYSGCQSISPLLRSDFAQSTVGRTPHGDLTDSFVSSDGRAPVQ
jgi:hypothetical protein